MKEIITNQFNCSEKKPLKSEKYKEVAILDKKKASPKRLTKKVFRPAWRLILQPYQMTKRKLVKPNQSHPTKNNKKFLEKTNNIMEKTKDFKIKMKRERFKSEDI